MKTRKLMAVLVMVAMIVTALPVVALADGEALGEAVADACRIYASKNERDVGDEVTISLYLRDSDGAVATNLSTNVFIWAERTKDEWSRVDKVAKYDEGKYKNAYKVKVNGKVVTSNNSLMVVRDNYIMLKPGLDNLDADEADGIVDVAFTSNIASEVKFWFGFGPDIETAIDKKAKSVTVKYIEKTKDYQIKLVGGAPGEEMDANGIDAHKLTIKVTDVHGLPLKDQKVLFDTSSSRLILNKTSAVTDSAGEVEVKATSERAGTYTLYAKLDSNRKIKLKVNDKEGVELPFSAAGVYDIKVKKGDGAVIALDEDYTFEFEIFDIFGRVIKGDNARDEDKKEIVVEVTTYPSGADFKKVLKKDGEELAKNEVGDLIEWTGTSFKVKAGGKSKELDKEGDYVLRVKLANGKYATAKFEVKEQGDIVGMTLEYDPAYTSEKVEVPTGAALRFKTEMPKVKLVDVDGIEAEIEGKNKDLEFSVNNTRIAKISNDGVVEQRYDDSEGVVVVTVVHTDHNLAATAEVRVGEVGVAGIKFLDVPDELLVDEEYTIKMKVLDEDGHEIMKNSDYKVIVLSKPADAKVELDEDGDKFTIYSDTKGQVKLIATARKPEEDKAVSGTLTLDFVTERAPVVEGKVFLTIGANFGLVDGVAQGLDAPAFIEDGRTFVPVRFLAEAFGAEADYEPKDAAVETVILTRDDMEIVIGIGDEFLTVTVDEEAEVLEFDGAARIVDGRTFLPFRAIAEAFDAEVDYGPKEGLVEWVSFE